MRPLHSLLLTALVALVAHVHGAPAASSDDLASKLSALQSQLESLQKQLSTASSDADADAAKAKSWRPRMVAWQPMKKSVDREQIILAIEERLSEVLRAGEKLGVSADEVLEHLRIKNSLP